MKVYFGRLNNQTPIISYLPDVNIFKISNKIEEPNPIFKQEVHEKVDQVINIVDGKAKIIVNNQEYILKNDNIELPNGHVKPCDLDKTAEDVYDELNDLYNQFYGNVIVQGSTIPDGDWYPIQLHSYANTSETFGYVVKGYHPYIRVSFTSNGGEVDKVLSR